MNETDLGVLAEALINKDWKTAAKTVNKMWVHIHLANCEKNFPEVKELNYIKSIITINDSTYLLSLLHISGPKIQLKQPVAEEQK